MNKKTVILLSTTMMSIATAACAFCMAQSANAAENVTSASAVVNANSNVSNPGFSDGGGGILLLKILIMVRVMLVPMMLRFPRVMTIPRMLRFRRMILISRMMLVPRMLILRRMM